MLLWLLLLLMMGMVMVVVVVIAVMMILGGVVGRQDRGLGAAGAQDDGLKCRIHQSAVPVVGIHRVGLVFGPVDALVERE